MPQPAPADLVAEPVTAPTTPEASAAAVSRPHRWTEAWLFVALILIATLVRVLAMDNVSGDYRNYLVRWYTYLENHGGFGAFSHSFSNYNVPYLYLLAICVHLHLPAMVAVKVIGVVFDAVLAFFVYRLVMLASANAWVSGFASLLVMLAPTIWLNSAVWGQADGIYVSACVAGLYYLMRGRPWLAAFLIGTAVAVKLQGAFMLPVLLFAACVKLVRWRTLLAVPAAYVVLAIPALLLGHPLRHLFLVYIDQFGYDKRLTANAPTLYQFFRVRSGADTLRLTGMLFAVGVVLILILLLVASRTPMTNERLLLVALAFAVLVPFVLPGMHERYFYLADVLSIVYAMYVLRLGWVALLVQISSLLSYVAFLYMDRSYAESVDQRYLAAIMFAALLLILVEVAREFSLRDLPAALARR